MENYERTNHEQQLGNPDADPRSQEAGLEHVAVLLRGCCGCGMAPEQQARQELPVTPKTRSRKWFGFLF